MEDVKKWIVEWFARNTTVSIEELHTLENENYFDRGLIDSLKFVSFIMEIEEKFQVSLSNDDFQDRSFSTISGLAKILGDKIKAGSNVSLQA